MLVLGCIFQKHNAYWSTTAFHMQILLKILRVQGMLDSPAWREVFWLAVETALLCCQTWVEAHSEQVHSRGNLVSRTPSGTDILSKRKCRKLPGLSAHCEMRLWNRKAIWKWWSVLGWRREVIKLVLYLPTEVEEVCFECAVHFSFRTYARLKVKVSPQHDWL